MNEAIECFGLGLVRSVDAEAGLLYLLTPIPPSLLATVDAIAPGAIDTPLAMHLPTAYTVHSPYVTTDTVKSVGAASMQSRNNLVRGPA